MEWEASFFVGPMQDPPPELFRFPNVHFLPPVPPEILPSMASQAACLIMPYSDSEVTRAMQPLKLKEYLAAGRAVVARKLPSTEPWADACHLVSTSEDFADRVVMSFEESLLPNHRDARRRLSKESWATKANEFYQYVEQSFNDRQQVS